MNWRVGIQEDIKSYQETLSYVLNKVDYSIGESIYMLPSYMNLNISLELWDTTTEFSYPMLRFIWAKS